jgi:hypothetical protein
MHGGHTGAGAGSSGGAAYRAAAGYAEAQEDVDGARAGRQGGSGGMALTGLRRSSSGGSTSGLHGLTSPSSMQRVPRESPRGWPAAPADAPHAGRRGPSGTGTGGLYRSGSAAYYPSPPMETGPAGGGSGGAGSVRGREEGASLPTPWQVDRRRSSADGWGHGQDGGGEGPSSGPGAGKPWGRQAGRGRGMGGYHRA